MKLLILIVLLTSFNLFASECRQSDVGEIQQITIDLIKEKFPQLGGVYIELQEFSEDGYYLQAHPRFYTLVGPRSEREYVLEINQELYECSPSKSALKSIIAHELTHISGYEEMTLGEIINLGINYTSKEKRARYERQTDMNVIELGLADGLIEYRQWLYQRLNSEELELKKYYYLTPKEILALKRH